MIYNLKPGYLNSTGVVCTRSGNYKFIICVALFLSCHSAHFFLRIQVSFEAEKQKKGKVAMMPPFLLPKKRHRFRHSHPC